MSTSTNTSCIRCKHMLRPDNQRYEGFICTNPIVMARYNEDTGRTTSQMYIDQARPMFCQGRLFEEKVLAGEKAGASAAHAEVPGNMFKKCEVLTETNVGYAASAQGFPKVSVERCEDYPNCPNLCCPPGKCNRNRPIANCSRGLFETWVMETKHPRFGFVGESWLDQGDEPNTYANDYVQGAWVMWQANRPAQTEQQPIGYAAQSDIAWGGDIPLRHAAFADYQVPVYATPIEQTAPTTAACIPVAQLLDIRHALVNGAQMQRLFLLAELLEKAIESATGKPFGEVQKP